MWFFFFSPKLPMIYSNLVNYTVVSKIKTIIFPLLLNPAKISGILTKPCRMKFKNVNSWTHDFHIRKLLNLTGLFNQQKIWNLKLLGSEAVDICCGQLPPNSAPVLYTLHIHFFFFFLFISVASCLTNNMRPSTH